MVETIDRELKRIISSNLYELIREWEVLVEWRLR